jgi:hypothetical protein
MDKELLKKIAHQQTERFLYSYAPDWRLQQILSIEKQLLNKFEFFQDIVKETRSPKESASVDAVIAQEITNGLFLEAMSIAIQSIEDVFAMLLAGQKPLKFIGGTISYSAGKVDNFIKRKHNEADIATLFYFPLFSEPYETPEQQQVFKDGLSLLFLTISELKDFYITHRFFYNQYKHGLSVALRAYVDYNEDQISDRRIEPLKGYPIAFDNYSVTKLDSTDIRVKQKILMPYLTSEIRENIQQLILDDNLLRFVTPDDPVDFGFIKSIVAKARMCLATFGNNILATLADKFPMPLQLPAGEKDQAYIFQFPKEAYTEATNKQIFV